MAAMEMVQKILLAILDFALFILVSIVFLPAFLIVNSLQDYCQRNLANCLMSSESAKIDFSRSYMFLFWELFLRLHTRESLLIPNGKQLQRRQVSLILNLM